MKRIKVFVDGQEGTTGLKIHERLAGRDDIEPILIDPALRKDSAERARLINSADLVFLCLPDDASREAVSLCTNGTTRFIDASTAFRTHKDWTYGFPELSPAHHSALAGSKRVANPGCYATGFIALVLPLVSAGIMPRNYPVSCFAISGYSGAGKKGIQQYESALLPENRADYELLRAPRPYALGLSHKHLPEMQAHTGLAMPPAFTPIIGNFAQGMLVHLHLDPRLLAQGTGPEKTQEVLARHYQDSHFVRVAPWDPANGTDGGFLDPQALNDTNYLDIFVHGNRDQFMVTARLDNLGKGASGAAVQSMNIMFGMDEKKGLSA